MNVVHARCHDSCRFACRKRVVYPHASQSGIILHVVPHSADGALGILHVVSHTLHVVPHSADGALGILHVVSHTLHVPCMCTHTRARLGPQLACHTFCMCMFCYVPDLVYVQHVSRTQTCNTHVYMLVVSCTLDVMYAIFPRVQTLVSGFCTLSQIVVLRVFALCTCFVYTLCV